MRSPKVSASYTIGLLSCIKKHLGDKFAAPPVHNRVKKTVRLTLNVQGH